MKSRLIGGALAMSLMTGCSGATEAAFPEKTTGVEMESPLPQADIDPAAAAERIAIATDWIDQAQKIADGTGNQQAQNIIAMFEQSGVMTPYGPGAAQYVKTPALPYAPSILPIKAGDELIDPKLKDKLSFNVAAAFYLPDTNIVNIVDVPMSDTFKGLILLHEGNHAEEFVNEQYNYNDPAIFTQHEYGTHVFENRLMASIGGAPYKKFLDAYAAEIGSKLQSNENGGFEVPAIGPYNPTLNRIFGPALSEQEKQLRQTHVWLAASFQAIDASAGESAERQKLNLLRTLYEDAGIVAN